MTTQPSEAGGWSISEARERVDPELWKQLKEIGAKLDVLGGPLADTARLARLNSGVPIEASLAGKAGDRERLTQERGEVWRAIGFALRDRLASGAWHAYGVPIDGHVEVLIPQSRWPYLRMITVIGPHAVSRAAAPFGSEIVKWRYDDVRIFPGPAAVVRKASKRGNRSLAEPDRRLHKRMAQMIERDGIGPTEAARRLTHYGDTAPGDGTPENKVRRLASGYNKSSYAK